MREEEPVLLPTPGGGTRQFQSNRPVSPAVRAAIQRAALLAMSQRERTPQQVVQDGQAALERARCQAIITEQAVDNAAEIVSDVQSDQPSNEQIDTAK